MTRNKLILVFLLGVGLLRADVSPSQAELVKARAGERSRALYYAVAKIRGLGFKSSKKNRAECTILSDEGSVVVCTVTDVIEDLGWTQGVEVRWLYTFHDDGKAKLFFSSLKKVEQ